MLNEFDNRDDDDTELSMDKLFYPTIIYHQKQNIANIKSSSVGFEYEEYEQETIEKLKNLSNAVQEEAEFNTSKPRRKQSFSKELQLHLSTLSDETKVSFILPPDTPSPFHIRYRENIGKKKGAWKNPLTFKDGAFFSPKLRVKTSEYVHGNKRVSETFKIPPPLLLSKFWERNNIINDHAQSRSIAEVGASVSRKSTDSNVLRQRIYTINGLTPSVEKGDTWTSWLVGTAGQGYYGVRTVEIQFAAELHERAEDDGTSVLVHRSFDSITDQEWNILPSLLYQVPSVDIFTSILSNGLNWVKSTGVKQLELALIGELQRNRGKNIQLLQQFFQEMVTKLHPIWENQLIPYLSDDTNLQYLLRENRVVFIRRCALGVMEFMKKKKLVENIPKDLYSIQPQMVSLSVTATTSSDGNEPVTTLDKKNETFRYQILPGTTIKVEVRGKPMYRESELVPSENELGNEREKQPLKIWFQIYNRRTERYLDVEDEEILVDAQQFIECSKTKRKLRKQCIHLRDCFSSSFCLRGRDKHGNNLIEDGTTLEVKAFIEQFGAHEDREVHFKLKYRDESINQGETEKSENQSIELQPSLESTEVDDEVPVRRSNVKILSIPKSRDQIRKEIEALTLNEELQTLGFLNLKFLKVLLEQLGNYPSSFDLLYFVQLLKSKGIEEGNMTFEEKTTVFVETYYHCSFNQSVFSIILGEINKSVTLKKEHLLKNVLKIPDEELLKAGMSFSPINDQPSSLFSFPETNILLSHATGLCKSFLCRKYVEFKKESSSSSSFSDNLSEGSRTSISLEDDVSTRSHHSQRSRKKIIDIENEEDIENNSLSQVSFALLKSLAVELLGRNLPESSFQSSNYRALFRSASNLNTSNEGLLNRLRKNSDVKNYVKRREWIDTIAKEKTSSEIASLAATWMAVGFFREYKVKKMEQLEFNRMSKEARMKIAQEKRARVMRFISEATVSSSTDSGFEPDFFDVGNVIVREILKTEIDSVIKEVVPQVSQAISEKLIPAVASGIVDGIRSLLWKNKWKIGFSLFSTVMLYVCFRYPEKVRERASSISRVEFSELYAKSLKVPSLFRESVTNLRSS